MTLLGSGRVRHFCEIFEGDDIAILELRGGTHLLLQLTLDQIVPGTAALFDLIDGDIKASRGRYESLELSLSAIEEDSFHQSFTIRDPFGNRFAVSG